MRDESGIRRSLLVLITDKLNELRRRRMLSYMEGMVTRRRQLTSYTQPRERGGCLTLWLVVSGVLGVIALLAIFSLGA
jgi:hypothetical protein